MDPERDRRLEEAGEPAWGDVLPGTDEVEYYVANGLEPPLLIRTVGMQGAFYMERYGGHGTWILDSDVSIYLGALPGQEIPSREISGREAADLMAKLDTLE